MSFFNFWLFFWALACLTLGVLPGALGSFRGWLSDRARSFSKYEEAWQRGWLIAALLAVPLEIGRHLPWVVIRFLPELTALLLGSALAWSVGRNYELRHQNSGVTPALRETRAVLGSASMLSAISLLVWLGGQFF